MVILEFNKLSKKYGKFSALQNLNCQIESNRIIGLLGPNGSGKTTLIKLINGLLQPSFGEVLIKGQKPSPETKKIISYLPERTYLNKDMKVKASIKFFKDFYEDFDVQKAERLITGFNIPLDAKMSELSKGMKEKVQLSLVVSRQADLYILDEPIAGVDPASRDVILSTIKKNIKPDSTVLFSTHLINDVEDLFDEVIILKDGKIELMGNAKKLKEKEGKSIDAIFRELFR